MGIGINGFGRTSPLALRMEWGNPHLEILLTALGENFGPA